MKNIVSNIMLDMIAYNHGDARRINHALKVHDFAKCIGVLEGLEEHQLQVLEIAAILHDIGIHECERKYASTAGGYQEQEGPPIAKDMLARYQLHDSLLDRVCFLIGNHHTYTKIDDIVFQILVEADFLVNIFEDQLSQQQIQPIQNKYFKTKTGIKIFEDLYGDFDTKK